MPKSDSISCEPVAPHVGGLLRGVTLSGSPVESTLAAVRDGLGPPPGRGDRGPGPHAGGATRLRRPFRPAVSSPRGRGCDPRAGRSRGAGDAQGAGRQAAVRRQRLARRRDLPQAGRPIFRCSTPIIVPPVGGDTGFASTIAAFAALSPGYAGRACAACEAVHSYDGPGRPDPDGPDGGPSGGAPAPGDRRRGALPQPHVRDPLRRHDRRGEPALDRLPGPAHEPAGVHLPPRAGAPARWSCGTTASPCTTRSTTSPASGAY